MNCVDPATLAPQANTTQDAAERRAVALWLVIEDESPSSPRRYAVTADDAWRFYNHPYDHMSGAYETPSDAACCYYAPHES